MFALVIEIIENGGSRQALQKEVSHNSTKLGRFIGIVRSDTDRYFYTLSVESVLRIPFSLSHSRELKIMEAKIEKKLKLNNKNVL